MKKLRILALILVVLMLFSGCKKTPEQTILAEAVYPEAKSYSPNDTVGITPTDFYKTVTPVILADDENSTSSPFGLYLALSMLAECTEGNSRKQILNLLGSDVAYKNTEKANKLFKAANVKDTKIATSLWLGDECNPLTSLKETLPQKLMSSMYKTDFKTDDAKKQISEWINKNTNNFIKDAVADLDFDTNTIMAIVSTLYFDSEWSTAFDKEKTAPDGFYAKSGKVTADFMNEFVEHGTVYTFSDSTAVTKRFTNGCEMAFILPNEDKTPADVIKSGEFYNLLTDEVYYTNYDINLSLPKFDITSNTDLIDDIKSLGVTDIFNDSTSDFSPLGVDGGWVNKIQQMTRVTINEERAKAASSTIVGGAWLDDSGPIEQIDFKLNRPFVFMIVKDNIPLFVGTVANPN